MRAPLVLAVLGGLALATPAAAQKTEDEARLVFTMGLTYTGNSSLWAVQDQPILIPGTGFDLIDITRSINGSLGLLFSGMYFPKRKVGLAGEVFFMGIGLQDQCATASPNPNPRTQELCSSINGSTKSSSAVLFTVGPVLRTGEDQSISPYVRAQVGLLFSNLSPIATSGTVSVYDSTTGTNDQLQYNVYTDPSSTRITPGFVLGGGFTTPLGKGWQLRAEVRDNLVEIATVAGPTGPGDDTPAVVNKWKNLFSIVIGADVVLEKKRGRRY
jgi:hypothetical protein